MLWGKRDQIMVDPPVFSDPFRSISRSTRPRVAIERRNARFRVASNQCAAEIAEKVLSQSGDCAFGRETLAFAAPITSHNRNRGRVNINSFE